MKKWFIFLIKLALTVACLWWALSRQKIRDELGRSVSAWPEHPAWEWAILGIALGGLTVVLSAFRWWVLLRAQQIPVRLWRVVELTLIGGLFNLFGVSSVTIAMMKRRIMRSLSNNGQRGNNDSSSVKYSNCTVAMWPAVPKPTTINANHSGDAR